MISNEKKTFNTDAARKLIAEVEDVRFPVAIRAVILSLREACNYIDGLDK